MRAARFVLIAGLVVPSAAGSVAQAQPPAPPRKVVVTSPLTTDVVISQPYVGQVRAQRHVEVRALSTGYLEAVPIRDGQAVKRGDVLFRAVPALLQAKLEVERAEVQLARLERDNAKSLFDKKVVSAREMAIAEAKLASAEAKARVAEVELSFATYRAPFDGLVGRIEAQEGSLVKAEDTVTTLSDGRVVWVYFNVPEVRYFEHVARQGKRPDLSRLELVDSRLELVLADGSTFAHHAGNTVTVAGKFNSESGNIVFRADFPNPDGLLRHGQTGTVAIRRTVKNATVVPQRATFEHLDRRYVYVVGGDHVVHPREIVVRHEVDDLFVVEKGLDATDRFVLDGVHWVRDGETVADEFRKPEEATTRPKAGRPE